MENKGFLIYIMMLVLFAFGLCGCGSKKKETSDITTTQAETTTEEKATTTEAVVDEKKKDEEGFYIVDDYVKTIGMTVNVRVAPDTDSNIYKLLETGTVLNRTGYNDEWARVVVDGDDFYIYGEFLEETDEPVQEEPEKTDEQDEDGEAVQHKIVIDPGKQAVNNISMEKIGPDSEDTKPASSTGIIGANYGTRESKLNLDIAVKLQSELTDRGYVVELTRQDEETDISNKSRAEFANTSDADILIRIQMTESSNAELSGVLTAIMPSDSRYNGELYDDSVTLATRILQGIVEETSCENRGIIETDDMTVINWSEIPVAVVSLGFLSNEEDEKNLIDEEYQDKLITGFANGIDNYFN